MGGGRGIRYSDANVHPIHFERSDHLDASLSYTRRLREPGDFERIYRKIVRESRQASTGITDRRRVDSDRLIRNVVEAEPITGQSEWMALILIRGDCVNLVAHGFVKPLRTILLRTIYTAVMGP